MASLDEFERALSKGADDAVKALVELQKRITLEAFQQAGGDIRSGGSSPVWTGRFMRSHSVSIGSAISDEAPPHPEVAAKPSLRWPESPDVPYRGRGVAYASGKMLGLKPFDVVYISNALPYAARLEDGYSAQTPLGVYRVIAEALKAKYAKVEFSVVKPR